MHQSSLLFLYFFNFFIQQSYLPWEVERQKRALMDDGLMFKDICFPDGVPPGKIKIDLLILHFPIKFLYFFLIYYSSGSLL